MPMYYIERRDVSYCYVEADSKEEAIEASCDPENIKWEFEVGDTVASVVD
jgi:hypothetical protein